MDILYITDYLEGRTTEEAFAACFAAAEGLHHHVKIVIAPGEYHLSALEPVRLFSGLSVLADGAEFFFPETMDDPVHRTMFMGTDICDLSWKGGRFHGHVYYVPPAISKWRPDACSRCIAIETSTHGRTSSLRFDCIQGVDCAGSVISVYGHSINGVRNKAGDIVVRDCKFERCGKFMWDYGYLWERLAFPELFSPDENKVAELYFPMRNLSGAVCFNGDSIDVENIPQRKPEARYPWDSVCFCGKDLPPEIIRGKVYFVVAEKDGRIAVSETPDGLPIRTSPAKGDIQLFRNMFDVFHWGYAPQNQGPGKGGLDLVCCRDISVSGCTLSANGDTMHIKESSDVVFCNNRIKGSRMGAFFLAFDCDHVTASGNVVNGTNGSRVLTVEKGCRDVVISENVFYNGGRGCWMNNVESLILKGNVFKDNVLKGVPSRGRHSPFSGTFERYPELYFAHAGKGYGNIIVSGNIFQATDSNTEPTILFQEKGHDLLMENNIFRSGTRQVAVAEGITLNCNGNIGISEINHRLMAEPL